MSKRTYSACHQAVNEQHDNPPNSFLDQLIDVINSLPDEVFEKNNRHDIYSVMLGSLGPYSSLLHRKAVMCEVLRVQAGFESDWNWNEGVDITNSNSTTHKEGEETGAFQVSWDSMPFDNSLKKCMDRLAGGHDVDTFINKMKSNHVLAVEYCARLLRFNTTWCGTINDPKKVIAHVRRDAVAEFQSFLQIGVSHDTTSNQFVANGTVDSDKNHIAKLLEIASNVATLDDAQARAARDLLAYDGEVYPQDGCAITLSVLLRDAGIDVPLTYQAIELGEYLKNIRKWEVISIGEHKAGDVGSTCGDTARHGFDHIYLVLKKLNDDEMLIADNRSKQPHSQFVSGKERTPTKFFLRAV
ncbi:MAG: hypothetical protein D0528_09445 [Methylococcales bacterium]|nr:MAG: hypothetical protein D0528_09445 [Methylococcales bacterium]